MKMTLLLQAAYRIHVVFIRTIMKFRGDTHSKKRLEFPDSKGAELRTHVSYLKFYYSNPSGVILAVKMIYRPTE